MSALARLGSLLLIGLRLAAASDGVRTRKGLLRPSEEVTFEPEVWNAAPEVRRSHNCYEYSLNDIDRNAARGCGRALGAGRSANSAARKRCRRFFHIPGYYYQRRTQHHTTHVQHFKHTDVMCQVLMARVASDNERSIVLRRSDGEVLQHDDHCPHNSHYMAALVVDPKASFHFYRRDHICKEQEFAGKLCWSHKPGIMNATRFDGAGKAIPDLRTADRSHGKGKYRREYSAICGYYCVPQNGVQITHSASFLRHKPAASAIELSASSPGAAVARRRRRSITPP